MNAKIDELQETSTTTASQLADANAKIASLQTDLDTANSEITRLNSVIDLNKSDIERLTNDNADKDKRIEELETQNSEYLQEIYNKNKEIKEKDAKITELEEVNESLTNDLDEAKAYIKDLNLRYEALQKQLEELMGGGSHGTATVTIPESTTFPGTEIKLYQAASDCPEPRIEIKMNGATWYAKLGDKTDSDATGITYKDAEGNSYSILQDAIED